MLRHDRQCKFKFSTVNSLRFNNYKFSPQMGHIKCWRVALITQICWRPAPRSLNTQPTLRRNWSSSTTRLSTNHKPCLLWDGHINLILRWEFIVSFEPFWCWRWNIPWWLSQYHCCWWPGDFSCQVISSHGIDCVYINRSHFLLGKISTTGAISVLRNRENDLSKVHSK